jgi:hypothetical protein
MAAAAAAGGMLGGGGGMKRGALTPEGKAAAAAAAGGGGLGFGAYGGHLPGDRGMPAVFGVLGPAPGKAPGGAAAAGRAGTPLSGLEDSALDGFTHIAMITDLLD